MSTRRTAKSVDTSPLRHHSNNDSPHASRPPSSRSNPPPSCSQITPDGSVAGLGAIPSLETDVNDDDDPMAGSLSSVDPHRSQHFSPSPSPSRKRKLTSTSWNARLVERVADAQSENLALSEGNRPAAKRAHLTNGVEEESRPNGKTPDADLVPSQSSQSEGRVPDDLAPDDLAPDDLAPDDLAPDDLAPDDLAPDDLAPDDLAPDDLAPDDEALPGTSFEMTPVLSAPQSPTISGFGDDEEPGDTPLAKPLDQAFQDIVQPHEHESLDAEDAEDVDDADVAIHSDDDGRVTLGRRRLGGRRRAAHPDPVIEAALRRQTALKSTFRHVARVQKALLVELADRTVEELETQPDRHTQVAEHAHVMAGLDGALRHRQENLHCQQRLNADLLQRTHDDQAHVLHDQYRQSLDDLQDVALNDLEHEMLRIERAALVASRRRAAASAGHDAVDHETSSEDDDPVPRTKRMGRHWKQPGPPLEPQYDSRSRSYVETQHAMAALETRVEMAAMLRDFCARESARAAEDGDSTAPAQEPSSAAGLDEYQPFTVMDDRPHTYGLRRRAECDALNLLADAARECQRQDEAALTAAVVPNDRALGLMTLGALASRHSTALANGVGGKSRQHPPLQPPPPLPTECPASPASPASRRLPTRTAHESPRRPANQPSAASMPPPPVTPRASTTASSTLSSPLETDALRSRPPASSPLTTTNTTPIVLPSTASAIRPSQRAPHAPHEHNCLQPSTHAGHTGHASHSLSSPVPTRTRALIPTLEPAATALDSPRWRPSSSHVHTASVPHHHHHHHHHRRSTSQMALPPPPLPASSSAHPLSGRASAMAIHDRRSNRPPPTRRRTRAPKPTPLDDVYLYLSREGVLDHRPSDASAPAASTDGAAHGHHLHGAQQQNPGEHPPPPPLPSARSLASSSPFANVAARGHRHSHSHGSHPHAIDLINPNNGDKAVPPGTERSARLVPILSRAPTAGAVWPSSLAPLQPQLSSSSTTGAVSALLNGHPVSASPYGFGMTLASASVSSHRTSHDHPGHYTPSTWPALAAAPPRSPQHAPPGSSSHSSTHHSHHPRERTHRLLARGATPEPPSNAHAHAHAQMQQHPHVHTHTRQYQQPHAHAHSRRPSLSSASGPTTTTTTTRQLPLAPASAFPLPAFRPSAHAHAPPAFAQPLRGAVTVAVGGREREGEWGREGEGRWRGGDAGGVVGEGSDGGSRRRAQSDLVVASFQPPWSPPGGE